MHVNMLNLKKGQHLDHILQLAKPALTTETVSILKQLKMAEEDLQQGKENPLTSGHYKQCIEGALAKLSPITLQEYKKRGIEFVASDQETIPYIAEDVKDHWQVILPIRYKNTIQCVLRTIEIILQIEYKQDRIVPNPQRRALIMARVFEANEKLAEYGWDIRGYDLAEKYRTDYYNGICEALEKGLISQHTPANMVQNIGHVKAGEELLNSVNPPEGVPKVFPSFGPAAYFEQRLQAIQDGQRPVKVGTEEFKALMIQLEARKSQGKDFTLTANILPNKAILTQPYFISRNIKSQHAINASGNHSVWAGEVVIDGDELLRVKDQSGHFITIEENEPDALSKFAVSVFAEHGYNTSQTRIEHAAFGGGRDLHYFLEPPNERPQENTQEYITSTILLP